MYPTVRNAPALKDTVSPSLITSGVSGVAKDVFAAARTNNTRSVTNDKATDVALSKMEALAAAPPAESVTPRSTPGVDETSFGDPLFKNFGVHLSSAIVYPQK